MIEITTEDLESVLEKFGREENDMRIQELFDACIQEELPRVEEAALKAAAVPDDEDATLANQREAAQEEIAEILFENDELPEAARCPHTKKLIPA